jgi:hypothetical protein
MSVDLGARSLVGGVDCNDPENSLFRFVCSFIFVHHHASITLHAFTKPKIIWNKLYFKSL